MVYKSINAVSYYWHFICWCILSFIQSIIELDLNCKSNTGYSLLTCKFSSNFISCNCRDELLLFTARSDGLSKECEKSSRKELKSPHPSDDEVCFFSLTGWWSFFLQKLPFRHRISGLGWFFFFSGSEVFFLLLRLVKFFLF